MANDLRHWVLRRLTPPFVFLLFGTSCPRQESVGLEGAGGPVGFEPVAGERDVIFDVMLFGFGARHRRRQHHAGVGIPSPPRALSSARLPVHVPSRSRAESLDRTEFFLCRRSVPTAEDLVFLLGSLRSMVDRPIEGEG